MEDVKWKTEDVCPIGSVSINTHNFNLHIRTFTHLHIKLLSSLHVAYRSKEQNRSPYG